MGIAVGIDLGTTNSCVAVVQDNKATVLADKAGRRIHPSVISFPEEGMELAGHAAKERMILDAENTIYSFKRLIGRSVGDPNTHRLIKEFPFKVIDGQDGVPAVVPRGREISLPEVSAMMLRHLRDIVSESTGITVKEAVITVPANFNDVQRSSTKVAGRIAGFDVLRILNEPTAAALAYGFGGDRAERIAIYDFGGGTFDITIVELANDIFEVLSTAGDTFLGGDDLDKKVVEQMRADFLMEHRVDLGTDPVAVQRVRSVAERVKCQLSALEEVQATLREIAYDKKGKSIDFNFKLLRGKFEKIIEPLVNRTLKVCDEALKLAGLNRSALDSLVLVGGTTRVPLVRRTVAEYFGMKPHTEINPDEVVAIGAAIQAFSLTGMQMPAQSPKKTATFGVREGAQAPAPPSPLQTRPTKKETLVGVGAPPQPRSPAIPMARPVAITAESGDGKSRRDEISGTLPAVLEMPDDMELTPRLEGLTDLPRPKGLSPGGFEVALKPEGTVDLPRPKGLSPGGFEVALKPEGTVDLPRPKGLPAGGFEVALKPEGGAELPRPKGLPAGGFEVALKPEGGAELIKPRPISAGGLDIDLKFDATGTDLTPKLFDDLELNSLDAPDGSEPLFSNRPPELPTTNAQRHIDSGFGALPDFSDLTIPDTNDSWGSLGMNPAKATAYDANTSFDTFTIPEDEPEPTTPRAAIPSFSDVIHSALADPNSEREQAFSVSMGTKKPSALLLDVTPRGLGLGTAGGFCEMVIERNAAIPVEQSRLFTTSTENQIEVSINIFQGESRRAEENTKLGQVLLTNIRAARRGEIKIRVTFEIDTDGILGVQARNEETGERQSTRIVLTGGMDEKRVEALVKKYANK